MEIVLFRVRTRADIDTEAYERTFEQMLELVAEIPGFNRIIGYTGDDGTELAVVEFESSEAIAAWRDHPAHVQARNRGREEFFAEYDITVATVSRQYSWTRAPSD
jgi:heme-degrading monooxygenase HmoA